MKRADKIFLIVCFWISLWLILEGLRWDYTAGFTPGPGFLPLWLGVVLGLFSLSLVYNAFKREPAKDDYKRIFPEKHGLYRIGLILLIFAGFAIIVETVGFELTVFIFVALILIVLEGYKIGKSIFYGVAFSGSLFLIFRYWMEIELPHGFFGY
jgi:hypothetical protein